MSEQNKISIEQSHTFSCSDPEVINDKLVSGIRELGHILRFLSEGKASQKRILIILAETGRITQKELTARLGIKPGSVSEILSKLENAGLIRRISNDTDRRTTDILLTEKGENLALEAAAQRIRRQEDMFSCLTEKQKTLLLDILETLKSDWNERYKTVTENSRKRCPHHGHHCHDEGNTLKDTEE